MRGSIALSHVFLLPWLGENDKRDEDEEEDISPLASRKKKKSFFSLVRCFLSLVKRKKNSLSCPFLSLLLFLSIHPLPSSSFFDKAGKTTKLITSCDLARCSEEGEGSPPPRLCLWRRRQHRCHQHMAPQLGEVTPPRGPPRRARCATPRWRLRDPLSEPPCARGGPPCPRRSAPAGPCLRGHRRVARIRRHRLGSSSKRSSSGSPSAPSRPSCSPRPRPKRSGPARCVVLSFLVGWTRGVSGGRACILSFGALCF